MVGDRGPRARSRSRFSRIFPLFFGTECVIFHEARCCQGCGLVMDSRGLVTQP